MFFETSTVDPGAVFGNELVVFDIVWIGWINVFDADWVDIGLLAPVVMLFMFLVLTMFANACNGDIDWNDAVVCAAGGGCCDVVTVGVACCNPDRAPGAV